MPLTDTAVRSAKPGTTPAGRDTGGKAYKLADSGGLYLEVMPTGARYWRLKYRHGGKEKRLAVGVYPAVTLAQARAARDLAKAALKLGRDPSADRRADKQRAAISSNNTFRAVAADWLAVRATGWTPAQTANQKSKLDLHVFPWVGDLPISEVSVADVRQLLDRIVKAGHVTLAHRVRQLMSRIFRHAVSNDLATRDPAGDLSDSLPARSYKRFSTITDPGKVGELLRALEGFGGTFPVRCALQLAPLVFVRPGELRAAEWAEIDFQHKDGPRWTIPAKRRKLLKAAKDSAATPPHVVPLSAQAVAILRDLHRLTGGGRFLFPHASKPREHMGETTINAALRRLGFTREDMTGHGFRHMASTLLNELGYRKDAIERQLSHKEPGVAGVYNLAELLPERKAMMQAWADYLDGLREGGNNITAIRSKTG